MEFVGSILEMLVILTIRTLRDAQKSRGILKQKLIILETLKIFKSFASRNEKALRILESHSILGTLRTSK